MSRQSMFARTDFAKTLSSVLCCLRFIPFLEWTERLNPSRSSFPPPLYHNAIPTATRGSPPTQPEVKGDTEVKGDSHQIWRIRSGEHREYKQTWQAYDCFFGLPRGRTVHSSPNRLAVSVTQLGSPRGRLPLTQQRNAATSASFCGWLTSCSQSVGRGKGHVERMGNAGSSRSTRRKLDQRHDSARSTRFARRAFRSTNDLVEVVFCFHRETLVTPLIETAVPDLVTMLLPPFHMRVGHLLHERGKIAIPLGPNDKMPMVGHQTVSAQPHPASSLRFLNDPLERQKVLVLGEKHSPAHAPVEHVENPPPPRRMSPRS